MASKKRTTSAAQQQSPRARFFIAFLLLVGLFVVGSLIALLFRQGNDRIGANTAIIRIIGPISGDASGSVLDGGGVGSTDVVEQLRKARDDDSINAVILEINSPGGSAVASDEIAQAVKEVRAQNKTVVAWIREEGASGAYWIASSSDHIVANRMSITGSIGVISSYLEFDRFLAHWNVSYNRLVAGDSKDIGDPFVNLTDDNRAFLQAKLDRVHEFFIEEVAHNRNMSVETVRPLADGRFFLGVEAYDAGLVDELGGEAQAISYIEKRDGITVETTVFEADRSLIDRLLGVVGVARTPKLQDMAYQNMRSVAPAPILQ